ncbi:MAG: Fic family protein, partial [Oscillospiraceae bacterium]|nr:Fic family protein [Oscillospiraceae bacterium]
LAQQELLELDKYYRVGLTYTSNALEGNTLTLSETKIVLEDGITVGGKPLRDHYEAVGHADAYDFMLKTARSENLSFTEEIILELHNLFFRSMDADNAGKYRNHQVLITGTDYVPPSADELSTLMQAFVIELNEKSETMHPVLLSAFAHRKLVDIHPFVDGNGRTARLLMNLILVNRGFQIVSIPPVLRHEYIMALQKAQRGSAPSDTLFFKLVAQCEIESQKDYCRMFRIDVPNHIKNPLASM